MPSLGPVTRPTPRAPKHSPTDAGHRPRSQASLFRLSATSTLASPARERGGNPSISNSARLSLTANQSSAGPCKSLTVRPTLASVAYRPARLSAASSRRPAYSNAFRSLFAADRCCSLAWARAGWPSLLNSEAKSSVKPASMVGRLIAQRDATRQLQLDAEQQQQRQTKLGAAEPDETANHAHAHVHVHTHVHDRTSGQGPPTGLNRDRVSVPYSTSSCGLRSA